MTSSSKVPRVSAVIPCFKTAQYVADTVASVFRQTYRDFEVVIVNDGSPDTPQLEQALAPWMENIVYIKTENQGVCEARNVGIRAAKGELIALLDSDDIWEPNCLDVQVHKLDEDPSADMVYPRFRYFGEGPNSGTLSTKSRGEVTFISLIQETCVVATSGVLAKRVVFERAGPFDRNLHGAEDFDMWLRCVKSGSRIIHHDQVLLLYRRHVSNLSKDPVRMTDGAIRVLMKMRTAVELTAEERQMLEKAICSFEARKSFIEGKHAFVAGDIPSAVSHLRRSGPYIGNTRLHAMLLLIWAMPRLTRSAYLWKLGQRN